MLRDKMPLFEDYYYWGLIDDINFDNPVPVETFLHFGLSQDEIGLYFELVCKLYCSLSLHLEMVMYGAPYKYLDINDVYRDYINFCMKHNLIESRAIYGTYHGLGLYLYCKVANEKYVLSMEEFRLSLETRISVGGNYDLLENTYFISSPDDGGMYLDGNKWVLFTNGKLVELDESDLENLHDDLMNDYENLTAELEELESQIPEFWHSRSLECRNYAHRYLQLETKLEIYNEALENIERYQEYLKNQQPKRYTLHIYKGQNICQKHHTVSSVNAMFKSLRDKPIILNALYCRECDKVFMDYDIYKQYRAKYGAILGDMEIVSNSPNSNQGEISSWALESPLKLCGYSVSQTDGLTNTERQKIISYCIDQNIQTKEQVISFIKWLIKMNGQRKGNEMALKKWEQDLQFALQYNSGSQPNKEISEIVDNKGNCFICY